MTYAEFLAACRKKAGPEYENNKSAFARLVYEHEKKKGKPRKSLSYYVNMESTSPKAKPPGRELLEAAVEAVGLGYKFTDCIHLPWDVPAASEDQFMIDEFKLALSDGRRPGALVLYEMMLKLKSQAPRAKFGGRKRKNK